MDKIIIARMGVEGGGATIFGVRDDGVWSFWQKGSSMDFDENDDEVWRSWSSDPVSELSAALPDRWWQMCPIKVHAEFIVQLRREYERCCGAGDGRADRFQHERWVELLFDGGPYAEPDGRDR